MIWRRLAVVAMASMALSGCGIPRSAGPGRYLVGTDIAEGAYATDPRLDYQCHWSLTRHGHTIYNVGGMGRTAVLNLVDGDWLETDGCGSWKWTKSARPNAG